jgi:hypothetical protein
MNDDLSAILGKYEELAEAFRRNTGSPKRKPMNRPMATGKLSGD